MSFAIAGVVPAAIAVLAIVLAKMPMDELAHPLDTPPVDPEGSPAQDEESVADDKVEALVAACS
jgi:hypothetical protein